MSDYRYRNFDTVKYYIDKMGRLMPRKRKRGPNKFKPTPPKGPPIWQDVGSAKDISKPAPVKPRKPRKQTTSAILRYSPRQLILSNRQRGRKPKMSTIVNEIKNARRVSTPLVCVRTADPAGTMAAIKADKFIYPPAGKDAGLAPILVWDIARGLLADDREGDAAKPGEKAHKKVLKDQDQSLTNNLTEMLIMLQRAPTGTIVFIQNAHRYMDNPSVTQALWNLRDPFKSDMRMVVMLCPSISLPAELQQDILMIEEPLPSAKELKEIAVKLHQEVEIKEPTPETLERIVDATLGLAAFPAEQAMAVSLEPTGIDIPKLWERKIEIINSSPGLSVWRGKEKFADIGGCDNIKDFLSSVIAGIDSPRGIILLDEVEKAIGTGLDTSGVSQGMLGQLLTWMEDNYATGCIFIGPPGAAKSAIAKAAGNEAGIPTIALDLGGMKASLVGESEARLRNGLRVIDSVTQKRALFLATCNSIAILPPELRRRFKFGTFAFGLPTKSERAKIWALYIGKYKLEPKQPIPSDIGWTGAEIKQACELAYKLNRKLVDCAAFIVPVSVSAGEQIEKLCKDADGKFVSAGEPGLFRYVKEEAASAVASVSRKVRFADPNAN